MNPEIIALLGGSALLVYSIEELSRSVQYLSGPRFRIWINNFANKKIAGIFLGFVLAVLLSSSGAVTVMLVGLANSRLLNLTQVFLVSLGASIGTTFIVHLFAFRISSYGLLILALGVYAGTLSKNPRVQNFGKTGLFLGLMFYSMTLIADSGAKLEENELFQYVLEYFRGNPSFSLIIATLFTAFIQSSAATIAFVMSLIAARNGNVYEAIPWVLGANLGTTGTAFLASFRTGALGKQAALGNLLFKLVGVILCYPLMKYLGEAAVAMGGDVSRQIANAHTLFNVSLTLLFLPFLPLGVKIVENFIPESGKDSPFRFQYLDTRMLQTPEVALAQAQREILRLADTVEQMVERSILLFRQGDQRELEMLKSMDQIVDYLNKGIKLYLTKLTQGEMTPEQVQREFELVIRTNDLENIGDIIDKNILELVRKNIKKGYTFSKEGWDEIMTFHGKVIECLRLSTAYFNTHDRAIYAKLMVIHVQLEDLVLDLTEQHMQRLHRGVKESLDTTSVHLDLLGNLQRIADLSINFTRIRGFRHESEEIKGS